MDIIILPQPAGNQASIQVGGVVPTPDPVTLISEGTSTLRNRLTSSVVGAAGADLSVVGTREAVWCT